MYNKAQTEVISDSNSTQVDKPNHNLEQNTPNSLEVEDNEVAQTVRMPKKTDQNF